MQMAKENLLQKLLYSLRQLKERVTNFKDKIGGGKNSLPHLKDWARSQYEQLLVKLRNLPLTNFDLGMYHLKKW